MERFSSWQRVECGAWNLFLFDLLSFTVWSTRGDQRQPHHGALSSFTGSWQSCHGYEGCVCPYVHSLVQRVFCCLICCSFLVWELFILTKKNQKPQPGERRVHTCSVYIIKIKYQKLRRAFIHSTVFQHDDTLYQNMNVILALITQKI